MNQPPPSQDLTRITLAVVFIGLMIVASLWILRPFAAATVWAVMVVVATWQMMLAVQRRLGGRRWAAVVVMTLAMLLVLVVPLVLAVVTIVDHVDDIAGWSKSVRLVQIGRDPPGAAASGMGRTGAPRRSEDRERMAAACRNPFG
jgi:predicted PurR-regulated permease PerM